MSPGTGYTVSVSPVPGDTESAPTSYLNVKVEDLNEMFPDVPGDKLSEVANRSVTMQGVRRSR